RQMRRSNAEMETPCQRHRRPTYFLCATSRASSFLVFPPEQSFFTLCKTPAPNFGISTARDGNVTPAPQNFPPNKFSPERQETSHHRAGVHHASTFDIIVSRIF